MQNKYNTTFVYFDTLGCAKNTCDTSMMVNELAVHGFLVVDNPDEADVIVINTCAFIEAAVSESIDTFFEYRNYYKDKKIIVAGCLPSRYGKELENSLKEADAFLPCDEEENIYPKLVSMGFTTEFDVAKPQIERNVFFYVKISEGCNRRCSYCMIPKIRGNLKSDDYEKIKFEVYSKQNLGASEIVLVAQDCGAWGNDFKNNHNLTWLLSNLSDDFPDLKFRILYVQPDAINNELLNVIADRDNIINYLDIPLQHCSSDILKSMNRHGSAKEFLRMVENIRDTIPECVLRTTFLIGFPGETDENFYELIEFAQAAKFDYAGCFEYSNEEGSDSAKLKNQVPSDIKYSRTNQLREVLDAISLEKLVQKIGNIYEVIIEGKEDNRLYGRAYFQAPEVDGYVYLSEYTNNEKIKIGDKLNVKILDTEGYDLVGEVV